MSTPTPILTPLVNGGFSDCSGNPLALGYLEFKSNQASAISGVGYVGTQTITVQLDANGNAVSVFVDSLTGQSLWSTDVMIGQSANGQNTVAYRVKAFSAAGQPVWGLNNQTVPISLLASTTAISISDGVLTVIAANTFSVGDTPMGFQFAGITALNGLVITVATATPTGFTALVDLPDGTDTTGIFQTVLDLGTWIPNLLGSQLILSQTPSIGSYQPLPFMDAAGNPIANGTMTMRLSQDAVSADGNQICAGIVVSVPLDDNGIANTLLYGTDVLNPPSTYEQEVFTSLGAKVYSQNNLPITGLPAPTVLDAPTFNPPAGTYDSPVTVTLSSPNATGYLYSLDFSQPSMFTTGTVLISSIETPLLAIAIGEGFLASPVSFGEYFVE
jgi:hypothetical protein